MVNYAYLMLVDADANRNKFYEITQSEDGNVNVKWGRIGGKVIEKNYGNSKTFEELVNAQLENGYQDYTALHATKVEDRDALKNELAYKPIEDEQTQWLMETLITESRDFMRRNYSIEVTDVTPKMIEEAEGDIETLIQIAKTDNPNTLYNFNVALENLFKDIPRKMDNARDFLAETENDFGEIIDREIEMLDNIRGQIQIAKTVESKDYTVLEAHGIDVRPVTYQEEDAIVAHLGRDYNGNPLESRFMGAYMVENRQTQAAYDDYKEKRHIEDKDVRLFYHGSRTENWYSIIKTGLLLKPEAVTTGSMFGKGLYFAPDLRKSTNYMDTKGAHWNSGKREYGFCAVYAVALGKCYNPQTFSSRYDEKFIQSVGCDSLFASKRNPHLHLHNDEYVVYNQAACTIKYLLQLKAGDSREMHFNLNRHCLRGNLKEGFDTIVKSENSLRAELNIENLTPDVQKEIAELTERYDAKRLFFNYDLNNATAPLSLIAVDINGNEETILPVITRNDYAFLCREMKRSFVDSEAEWKKLVKAAEEYPDGKIIANKQQLVPLNENKGNQEVKE